MTKDEALRLALEAFENLGNHHHDCPQWPTYTEPEKYPKCTCGYDEAITAIEAALYANEFNPDWDTQAVLVEEIQRMAKRIEELEAQTRSVVKDEPCCYGGIAHDCHAGSGCRIAERLKTTLQAKGEPVAWKWHQAPVKTQWGDDMVVADIAIDKDHTASIYCERNQKARVESMFTTPPPVAEPHKRPSQSDIKPLTDEEITDLYFDGFSISKLKEFARAIEAAHGIIDPTDLKGEA